MSRVEQLPVPIISSGNVFSWGRNHITLYIYTTDLSITGSDFEMHDKQRQSKKKKKKPEQTNKTTNNTNL